MELARDWLRSGRRRRRRRRRRDVSPTKKWPMRTKRIIRTGPICRH